MPCPDVGLGCMEVIQEFLNGERQKTCTGPLTLPSILTSPLLQGRRYRCRQSALPVLIAFGRPCWLTEQC